MGEEQRGVRRPGERGSSVHVMTIRMDVQVLQLFSYEQMARNDHGYGPCIPPESP